MSTSYLAGRDRHVSAMDAKRVHTTAIILAAGSGTRMGIPDKAFSTLGGRPVVAWSLDVFDQHEAIDDIVLVAGAHTLRTAQEMQASGRWSKCTSATLGGDTRFDSVQRGLAEIDASGGWVVLHDAARPFVTLEIISSCLDMATRCGAAIACAPIVDTIKSVEGARITGTVARDTLRAAQTPQVFRRVDLVNAITQAASIPAQPTDESMLYESLGLRVCVADGSRDNWKLTVPEDFALAESQLQVRLQQGQK